MPARLRRFVLTAHVVSSVGWLGAVAAFLALAIAGRTSSDIETVRGAYLGTELMTRFVIVPLCLASVLTGVTQGLGTPWGLFRHYWVLAKLLLTVFATVVLLLQLAPIGYMADAVAATTLTASNQLDEKSSLVLHSAGGLLVLITTATLSIYKPRGRTRYGWRKQLEARDASP